MTMPNATMRVKSFEASTIQILESDVNKFLDDNGTGSPVSFNYAFDSDDQLHFALLLYIADAFVVDEEEPEEYPENKTDDFDE